MNAEVGRDSIQVCIDDCIQIISRPDLLADARRLGTVHGYEIGNEAVLAPEIQTRQAYRVIPSGNLNREIVSDKTIGFPRNRLGADRDPSTSTLSPTAVVDVVPLRARTTMVSEGVGSCTHSVACPPHS